jgi:nitrogen fixation/metabolism regulation signal transduction histidine kinase
MIRRFTLQIVLRVLTIMLTSMLLALIIPYKYWFTAFAIVLIIAYEVYSLIRYVNQTNYSMVKFLDALKNEDYSVYFSPSTKGASFKKLYEDFNEIINIFKNNNIEKEAQYTHFKQILEQVNMGIISMHKEDLDNDHSENEILFLNKAASEILNQPRHKYWHRLKAHAPWFTQEINRLRDGGKVLLTVDLGHDQKQLSIEVIDTNYLHTPYLFITFQDIRSEIAIKEIEAWHNIIRVLAHEMLNSFTPVSSLASTIVDMTNEANEIKQDDRELINDINLAASTIKRRSDALLEFVNDYRTISSVPKPHIKEILLLPFLDNIKRLLSPELEKENVLLEIKKLPPKTIIKADERLLEQIFINLIGNSRHALKEIKNPKITIDCTINEKNTIIRISDNGKGIPPEIMNQIFIPFYTTRKEGSGIGLSLSKDIMKKHGGDIFVQSIENENTTFSLLLKN